MAFGASIAQFQAIQFMLRTWPRRSTGAVRYAGGVEEDSGGRFTRKRDGETFASEMITRVRTRRFRFTRLRYSKEYPVGGRTATPAHGRFMKHSEISAVGDRGWLF